MISKLSYLVHGSLNYLRRLAAWVVADWKRSAVFGGLGLVIGMWIG